MYTIENAYQIVYESLNIFFDEEKDNILSTISERSLVGQLSYRIKDIIKGNYPQTPYHVDIEYNRKQEGKIKTIISKNGKEDFEEIKITCDLIVHTRGMKFDEDNFIAIEMKKSNRPDDEKNKDKYRLIALTKPKSSDDIWSNDGETHPEHVCGYLLGVYIEINIQRRNVIIEFYENGVKKSDHVYDL
ncbi:hypothetical protein WH285_12200 [Acinetobacter johnsonii]|uniref:hypothetical protein n=1 Tax=Acinetobacter johnsonii TaxID=40214 RepID=UPI0030B729E6